MNSMTLSSQSDRLDGWQQWLSGAALAFFLSLSSTGIWASPGAHGPNGEHLDSPSAAAGSASTAPRMEARSETYELVAHLRGSELSMLIHRFETNEPVLKAQVEVESGALKAAAKFHEDMGDYAVDDPIFLKALKASGAHPLVITILDGQESDLLEGTLMTAQAAVAGGDGHGHRYDDEHGHGMPSAVWALLMLLLLTAASVVWMTRRSRKAQGGTQ